MVYVYLLLVLFTVFSPNSRASQPRPEKRSETIPQFYLDALIAPTRPLGDKARDPLRKPGQILHFFEIQPGYKVADMMAGSGYYVDILSRVVGEKGVVYAQNSPYVLKRFAEKPLRARLQNPELANVVRLDHDLETPHLPSNLDAVMIVLFYHDTFWQEVDRKKMNDAIFKALKPGGIFGVIDHHAEAGSGARDTERLHRVDANLVKKEILDAGFTFVARSHILSNPKDTRDYNIFRDYRVNRDQTDRFVFKFKKPLKSD